MKKFLVFMLIALALTLVLASCSGKEPKTTTTTQQITPEPPVHEHLYNEVVTSPTCTEQGYTTYTCDCGNSYVDDYVDAFGHTESDWIIDVEATTVQEGSKHTKCTVCGETIKTEVIEKLLIPTSEGLEFKLNEDGQSCYVKSTGTCTDTDIVIPDTYNGLPVTSIGDYAFCECTSLTSVTIPDSVISIGDYAFYECVSLTSITIPDSVISIGDDAFEYCASLTSITIPNSVKSIGEWAFCWCISLTGITIPDSITSISDYVFAECESLTSITIPDSVKDIGIGAFIHCKSLTSITIPDSVKSIGLYAFEDCTSLATINFDDTIEKWNSITKSVNWDVDAGEYIIYCTNGEIEKDGTVVYYPSENLEFTLNDDGKSYSVTGIGTCTNTNIVIPKSYNGLPVTSIGKLAFYRQHSLTSITIPGSVASIGKWAFYYCTSLTIYCEVESQPSEWSSYWNPYNCPVVWNYKNK